MLPEIASGIITIWHGTLASIPGGWALCNGTQGTPDLRNRFIICYGDNYDIGDVGGVGFHTHLINIDSHVHSYPFTTVGDISDGAPRAGNRHLNSATDSGTSSAVMARPPYYAFAFIMKL